ncbi:hypothetical protein [Bosea sp. (in: a-proteobacteria)]|uniref:hypothetical protein n=1 Tax=Bosea sp. (in: a-proteobacteria) TaxID=1871050 RepID=UPI003563C0A5
MKIDFDSAKRDLTLQERGLDFVRATEIFAGLTFTQPDRRLTMAKSASSPSAFSMDAWW